MTTVLVDEADYPIGIEGITKSFGAVDVLRGVDLALPGAGARERRCVEAEQVDHPQRVQVA